MYKIKKSKQRDPKLEEFRKKLQTDDRFKEQKVIISSGRENKLSEVLERFIEPYRHLGVNLAQYQRLITIATVAWNAALLQEDERQSMLNEACKAALPSGNDNAVKDFHAMMKDLVTRKERYFSSDERLIIDSEVEETENGYHLSVASTLIARSRSSKSV